MSGIWRWLKLKPSPAIESRRKTTTSTLNIISDQCLWTRNGNRKISVEEVTKPRPSSVSPEREDSPRVVRMKMKNPAGDCGVFLSRAAGASGGWDWPPHALDAPAAKRFNQARQLSPPRFVK
jgi:hypothetical protein